MDAQWNDSQPIYRQLRDRIVAMILEGTLKEGDPLPSVRNVAADLRLNPLTVLKGYQQLVDEVRLQLAIKYLTDTDLAHEHIAARLKFSGAANFRRAFRRWTGKAPSQLRAISKAHKS